jgi:hypothetical protein
VVLFDPDLIEDRATFENPLMAPLGISGVWMGDSRKQM